MCSTFGGPPRERKLQQLNSSGGHPKGRNELQKEVFTALFSAAEKSDEFPEITVKTEWRSKALGKVVSELPEESVPEYKANVVHLQQDNQTDNDEEDSFQALLRAVMEYRGTMKEYCKAVGGSCSSRKISRTELKKLPLDLEGADQGKILIKGKEDWWKQLNGRIK
ncbi:hypothetical protein KPL71_020937 [Citrus sinensis]|uniref:Uncharacterized protein n=2 Tax=Citrus sinensis TaxID=2711 RepID=A0ACB8JBP2_CITSI|nr:hypothetical protein KPL71_020934 [Citrus sinensis]KAH9715167.1 hypothetical protein KPL71_020937 [Citrus sinensis]